MTSELKPIDIWDDATNAVCQAMQQSKMCKCPDGECLASTIEPSKETLAHWNTRAVPDVPELVRWKHCEYPNQHKMIEHTDGEYVLYSQAAEIIAAQSVEISRFTVDECEFGHKYAKLSNHPHKDGRPQCPNCMSVGLKDARKRAEAAEASNDKG